MLQLRDGHGGQPHLHGAHGWGSSLCGKGRNGTEDPALAEVGLRLAEPYPDWRAAHLANCAGPQLPTLA